MVMSEGPGWGADPWNQGQRLPGRRLERSPREAPTGIKRYAGVPRLASLITFKSAIPAV